METSYYKSVFDLAARIGSLEGYLYVGKDVEAEYLPRWLENINRGFNDLGGFSFLPLGKECYSGSAGSPENLGED